jgi:type IV pilus assembly protein PilO
MEKFFDQFAKIPIRVKLLAMAGLIIAIAFLDWYLVVNEAQKTIEQNEEVIAQKNAELTKLQQQAANRTAYMREVERLKQRLREAEEQLPKTAEIPKLLRDIAYEAQQSGLLLERFELMNEEVQGDFARVPVKMRVSGSYHEVAVFLDRLSKMSRIVNVTNLNMSNPKLQNKKIVLSSTYLATTYRFLEKPQG